MDYNTATITRGLESVSPYLVLGFRSTRAHGNIIHPIENSVDPDVTFAPAGLRTGTMRLFFLNAADALEAEQLHTLVGVFTLVDTALPLSNMSYVPVGDIDMEFDEATQKRWTVTVRYQEVSP